MSDAPSSDASSSTDRLVLMRGDLTTVAADALVNTANASLMGGGGVDGALHRAAGPRLRAECRKLRGCPMGEARITGAGLLPARYVIHAVGPMWRGGQHGERELLANCYRQVFALVEAHDLRSVAFPSIATGVYGFPIEEAAPIALRAMLSALERLASLERVTAVLFSDADLAVYRRTLDALRTPSPA
ncbi:O-acetyl-ADP-ribose deacetylase [Melittangium boletus]|uniref:RNase III inhibitor n=1 Tax=Melittangium boletus DSM 14713 TaxID=1294270 RepID=A0A250IEP4_9BACT|nr:O-acetyl-ADP-ribose deacetylase [Melittangium boletus]ATB29632.1 RNase III inhibitor [Melittangium boletus DSM 14713]